MNQMNAILSQGGAIHLTQTEIPQPGAGQVLVKSLACGICGSDLHLTHHGEDVFQIYKNLGVMPADAPMDLPIALGHEFSAEVIAYGPQTQGKFDQGTRVTCVPILMSQSGAGIGVTPGLNGAYSEYFIVDEALLLEIPEQVSPYAAAVTEPLAVGLHSVNRSGIGADDVALVAGCGAIGLATIAMLKQRGVKHIIASDIQASKREKALTFGATHVVDPSHEDEVALASQTAEGKPLVIYECVGIHQLIDGFIMRAPAKAKLVITGIHTTPTQINLAYASVKEMDIVFSYYYGVDEFAACLDYLAKGEIPWQQMCTGLVGRDGVAEIFADKSASRDHIKIIIEPWRNGKLEALNAGGAQ